MSKSNFRCAVCGAFYSREADALACGMKPVKEPLFGIGAAVRSPFFYIGGHFPNGSEEQNLFRVVATDGFAGRQDLPDRHDRLVKVEMIRKPGMQHVFRESELEPARG